MSPLGINQFLKIHTKMKSTITIWFCPNVREQCYYVNNYDDLKSLVKELWGRETAESIKTAIIVEFEIKIIPTRDKKLLFILRPFYEFGTNFNSYSREFSGKFKFTNTDNKRQIEASLLEKNIIQDENNSLLTYITDYAYSWLKKDFSGGGDIAKMLDINIS